MRYLAYRWIVYYAAAHPKRARPRRHKRRRVRFTQPLPGLWLGYHARKALLKVLRGIR